MGDKLYWLWRNGSAYLLSILLLPFWLTAMVIVQLTVNFYQVVKMDGSTTISYPWEINWIHALGLDDL